MSRFRLLSLAALVLLCGSPGRVARGDEIPASARRLLEEHDKRVKEIKGKSAQALKDADKKLMDGLQALETSFKKEAKFKQAQAVAKLIQEIERGPRIHGKWSSVASTVKGQAIPEDFLKLEFGKDGSFVYSGGPLMFKGTYSLGPGDSVTLNLDKELAGRKTHVEKISIKGDRLTMTDSDGTALTFKKIK